MHPTSSSSSSSDFLSEEVPFWNDKQETLSRRWQRNRNYGTKLRDGGDLMNQHCKDTPFCFVFSSEFKVKKSVRLFAATEGRKERHRDTDSPRRFPPKKTGNVKCPVRRKMSLSFPSSSQSRSKMPRGNKKKKNERKSRWTERKRHCIFTLTSKWGVDWNFPQSSNTSAQFSQRFIH